MSDISRPGPAAVDAAISGAYRSSWGRVIAAAFGVTGDLDLAEESAAESFAAAAADWPRVGIPESVEAWLVTAARRRGIDQLRRRTTRRTTVDRLSAEAEALGPPIADDHGRAEDDELRFLALCAGRSLPEDAQVLLLLKYGMGVDTATLTTAFQVSRATMAARLTRAKKLLQQDIHRSGRIDGSVEPMLPVLHRAIYLIFTLGRVPPTGRTGTDRLRLNYADVLSAVVWQRWPSPDAAALRMMILVAAGAPEEAELLGRAIRFSADADRPADGLTPLIVQAAIMMENAAPARNWIRIAELYDVLLGLEPAPAFALGRAVAISYAFGPDVGLADLDDLERRTGLGSYRYLHAARGNCLDRLGRHRAASAAYTEAAARSANSDEQLWFTALAGRLLEPGQASTDSSS